MASEIISVDEPGVEVIVDKGISGEVIICEISCTKLVDGAGTGVKAG